MKRRGTSRATEPGTARARAAVNAMRAGENYIDVARRLKMRPQSAHRLWLRWIVLPGCSPTIVAERDRLAAELEQARKDIGHLVAELNNLKGY